MAKIKTIPDNMTTQFGKPGEMFVMNYKNEERRIDNLKITDYRLMLDNDGLIQMLWNAIVNTIMSAGFKIEDDGDIESEKSSKEKEFIEKVLFSPVWKGGMKTSFNLVSRTMLRAFVEGYRVFELVWKMGEDGKFYIDKVAPRAGKTDTEFYIVVDDNGEFVGFTQKVNFLNSLTDITVVNDGPIKKVVKATFGEEFGSNYGRSGLKAAWYHYDKAHKGMYLNHVGHELGAIKYRNFKHTLNDSSRVETIVTSLSKVGMESVGAFNKNDGELFFEDVADAGVLAVGKDMILIHYSMIAKSILAQFIDLGSNGASGNRALGETQMSFFKQGLQSIATIILEDTWNQIISDIVKVNFNNGIYPKLCINPIDDKKSETLYNAFNEMVKQGMLSDSIVNKLQEEISEKLDLDVTEEQILADSETKRQNEQEVKNNVFQQQQLNKIKMSEHVHLEDELEEVKDMSYLLPAIMRDLYKDENKVKLADIKMKLVSSENQAKMVLRNKLQVQKDGIVNAYLKSVREGKKAIMNTNVELQEVATYSDELYMLAEDLLNYGKIVASNELKLPVPNTPKADRESLLANIGLIILDQQNRLNFRLKQVANNALNADLPENQTRLLLESDFESFFDRIVSPTVDSVVPTYLNKGRQIAFDKYDKDIFAYRYTAVLDSKTTEYCRNLDGRVFQKNDPEYIMVSPPNHFGCRSIWTPITQEESEGVVVTGKPANVPVFGSISSFKDIK